jgi:cytochrome P450
MDIFSDDNRRNPYPLYAEMRSMTPVFKVPPPFDAWMIFDYDGVNRALTDHESFSSCVPAPADWLVFRDPPRHTKLRALIAKAFTPRMITSLEPLIRELSHSLLDQIIDCGAMDLASDFAVPLPMKVIAQMIGIPGADWPKFRAWSDSILQTSYARGGDDEAKRVMKEFAGVSVAMNEYLTTAIAERSQSPRDDLLSQFIAAEVDGQRLTHDEILGFFQLLIVGGQETTANLITNAILSLLENPSQLALLRANMQLLPSAIEESLRYRAPVQWVMRTPTRDIQLSGQTLSPGQLILAVIGSANRDPKHFERTEEFDITRDPNPHIAFGHGIHFCLGSALARMEARIALSTLLERLTDLERVSNEPWEPRKALHVHGPTHLSIRFRQSLCSAVRSSCGFQTQRPFGSTFVFGVQGEEAGLISCLIAPESI